MECRRVHPLVGECLKSFVTRGCARMPHPVLAFQSSGPLNTRDRSLLNEHRRQIIAGAGSARPTFTLRHL